MENEARARPSRTARHEVGMSRRSLVYVPLIRGSFDRRFQLARLTRKGRIADLVGRLLFEGDDMVVLPRDGAVKRIIHLDVRAVPENIALPSQVAEHFVRQASQRFIMNFCICRSADSCRDYPIELGCLFLGPGVEKIDPSLGSMATEEEALRHLRRCREAGLVHIIGRNKLDSMWLGTGKKEELMTICNCCPCCCLWKMLPELHPDLGGMMGRMPGVEVAVEADSCVGCGLCTRGRCYVNAISLIDGKAAIDGAACRGCGRCAETCSHGAIRIIITDQHAVDETIRRLSPLVRL